MKFDTFFFLESFIVKIHRSLVALLLFKLVFWIIKKNDDEHGSIKFLFALAIYDIFRRAMFLDDAKFCEILSFESR